MPSFVAMDSPVPVTDAVTPLVVIPTPPAPCLAVTTERDVNELKGAVGGAKSVLYSADI